MALFQQAEIPVDAEFQGKAKKAAWYWFSEPAAQGNECAQFFLDRRDNLRPPTVMLSVTRLLQHMGEIFRDNSAPPQAPAGQQVDRQLRLNTNP